MDRSKVCGRKYKSEQKIVVGSLGIPRVQFSCKGLIASQFAGGAPNSTDPVERNTRENYSSSKRLEGAENGN